MAVSKLLSSLKGMVEDTRVTTEPRDLRTKGPEDRGPTDHGTREPPDHKTRGSRKPITKKITKKNSERSTTKEKTLNTWPGRHDWTSFHFALNYRHAFFDRIGSWHDAKSMEMSSDDLT